jgi:hypothetical protein
VELSESIRITIFNRCFVRNMKKGSYLLTNSITNRKGALGADIIAENGFVTAETDLL